MIPFLDLRAPYKTIKDDVQRAIDKVFDTAQYILGDEVATFESEFAKHVNAERAVGPELSNNHVELVSAALHHDVHAL